MSNPAVGADVREAFDVHLYFAPQGTFDFVVGSDDRSDLCYLFVCQVGYVFVPINACLGEDLLRRASANPIDIGQANF